jgi:hypothetical protein
MPLACINHTFPKEFCRTERAEFRREITEPNTLSALGALWAGLRALCEISEVKWSVKYSG